MRGALRRSNNKVRDMSKTILHRAGLAMVLAACAADAAGKWVMERNWNGDQAGYGLNLTGHPVILKVRMGRY